MRFALLFSLAPNAVLALPLVRAGARRTRCADGRGFAALRIQFEPQVLHPAE